MKKTTLLIPTLFLLVIPMAYSVCVQSGVGGNYSVGEEVTVTITCGAADKGDAGHYMWIDNVSNVLENDTFTIPNIAPYVVYQSWIVTAAETPQTNMIGNLTVDNTYISVLYFNASVTGGVTDLDITDVNITAEFYEERRGGVRGIVSHQGKVVGYADVCIDVLDENGEPFSHINCKKTEIDGEFFMSIDCSSAWCDGGKSYILNIDASCPMNGSGYVSCIANGVEINYAGGGVASSFTVVDMADKVIIKDKWFLNHSYPSVYLRNQYNAKVNISFDPDYVAQEDIEWGAFDNTNTTWNTTQNGTGFLTSDKQARLCFIANNTFNDEKHIIVYDLTFESDSTHEYFYPIDLYEGIEIRGKDRPISHYELPSQDDENSTYEICTEWFLIPLNIKGSNDWDAKAHIMVEDYDQDFYIETDEFTIFGEEEGKNYFGIIDITNVTTSAFGRNITPLTNINVTFQYDFFNNVEEIYVAEYCFEQTDNDVSGGCYDRVINPDYGKAKNITDVFELPYFDDSGEGEVYISIYESESSEDLHFGGSYGNLVGYGDTEPFNTFTIKTFTILNLTTSFFNTSDNATACKDIKINFTYVFYGSSDDAYVGKYCFEQTEIDNIEGCFEREINPDVGYGNVIRDTFNLPYFQEGGEAEVTLELFRNDKLVEFSDMEPFNTFNVTADFSDACKYSQSYDQELDFRSTMALELGVDAEKKNNLTNSLYFANETINDASITETELLQFNITIIQNPAYGDTYKVTYFFFARSGLGELVDEVETEVTGVGNHKVYFRSDNLDPSFDSENYTVVTVVSMKNRDGVWEDFEKTALGNLTVFSDGTVLGGGLGAAGLYDVIVEMVFDKYEVGETVTAKITIKNLGDVPDEDTIMIYYLTSPEGERFGETKEQFLEVPPGETKLKKSITLPQDSDVGEWRFHVDYYTVVQPTIKVFDYFEVVTKLPWLDKVKRILKDGNVVVPAIIIFLLYLVFKSPKKEEK